MIMAVVLIALTTTSVAENVIHHRIVQNIDSTELTHYDNVEAIDDVENTDMSTWLQHGGIAGAVFGDGNMLDQYIEQDLNWNEGPISQFSNLTGIISGDDNTIFQSSRQSAENNSISNTPSGYPMQRSTEMVVVVGNHSVINQTISQIVDNSTVFNSKLSQIATQAAIVIGDDNSALQEINQSFINRTISYAGDINQTSHMRSIIVGSQNETGNHEDDNNETGNSSSVEEVEEIPE